jgi:hypothetical protein
VAGLAPGEVVGEDLARVNRRMDRDCRRHVSAHVAG